MSADINSCGDSFVYVYLIISLPIATFIVIFIALTLIYYLRNIQTYKIYDRCTERNAHFKYVFEIVCGQYTRNYNEWETSLIFDLLDNQLVSVLTIHVPGTTLFNFSSIFMHKHARNQLHLVRFYLFRRKPIRDIKCIRVAHTCPKPDAQIIVFGLNILDVTNAENKFFPVPAMVRYRGTPWALNTNINANNDLNFARLGCDCYDPYDLTPYLSYIDMTILAIYLYGSIVFFGALISISAIYHVSLHAILIAFISISSVILLGYGYVRLVKSHVVEKHFESVAWRILQAFVLGVILTIGCAFWTMGAIQARKKCSLEAGDWLKSCVIAAAIVTILFVLAYRFMWNRIKQNDSAVMSNTETELLKTLTNKSIELKAAPDLATKRAHQSLQQVPRQQQQHPRQHQHPINVNKLANNQRPGATASPAKATAVAKGSRATNAKAPKAKHSEDDLNDNTEGSETLYMRNRNVNSISQYV